MEINLNRTQINNKRKEEESMKLYLQWYEDYKNGMDTTQIAARYINPATGKPYTRTMIYFGFKQLRKKADFEGKLIQKTNA